MKAPVSVLVITHNEAMHIGTCLRSVRDWADEIFVVDSHSTDETCRIADAEGAQVVAHAFEYPAQQKNWALANLPLRNDWVLLLDADEHVPPELRDEIAAVVAANGNGFDGFCLRYRLIFYGKWIRHCGWYPSWILRLARRSKMRFEDRPVDEHLLVDGPTGRLRNDLIHESRRDLAFWIEKHNRYSSQNAQLYADLRRGTRATGTLPGRVLGSQAQRKRYIKQRIWPYLPARGLWFFFYMYVFRLGFLDGYRGLMFCVMHGIFQQFISFKVWELERRGESPVREDQS
jgi:glycosyltransferase involved in cell wall biosynthesis